MLKLFVFICSLFICFSGCSSSPPPKIQSSPSQAVIIPSPEEQAEVFQAYKSIPHRQTIFDASEATMRAEEKVYLYSSFALVDKAIKSRVDVLQWVKSKGGNAENPSSHQLILAKLEALQPPVPLEHYHHLLIQAIGAQNQYLKGLSPGSPIELSDSHVQSAHQSLSEAYMVLMNTYPNESSHNKDAFFDYLCAVDFI